MTFKVETGIPVPDFRPQRKYPFNEMKPGDSFLINGTDHASVANAATSYGRAMGRAWKFRVIKTSEGYRCWRLK